MPRNGSGIYTPPSGTKATPHTTIESSKYNGFVDDLAQALTKSVASDGQTQMAANLPMGGFKLTGLAAGSANGDSVRFEQSPAGILTTRGDLIRRGAAGAERVALGTLGQFLRSDGTDAVWQTLSGGDVIDDGTGKIITAPNTRTVTVAYVIDGGGAPITTGNKGSLVLDFSGTIQSATLLADQTGSVVVEIWKTNYAGYPGSTANKITASAPPTLSSAQKSQDTTLTGWTKAFAAGDVLTFNVNSVATVKRVAVLLKVLKG